MIKLYLTFKHETRFRILSIISLLILVQNNNYWKKSFGIIFHKLIAHLITKMCHGRSL